MLVRPRVKINLICIFFLSKCPSIYKKKHPPRHLYIKSCDRYMATKDPNVIVFVIIHGNKFHDGHYLRLSLTF